MEQKVLELHQDHIEEASPDSLPMKIVEQKKEASAY